MLKDLYTMQTGTTFGSTSDLVDEKVLKLYFPHSGKPSVLLSKAATERSGAFQETWDNLVRNKAAPILEVWLTAVVRETLIDLMWLLDQYLPYGGNSQGCEKLRLIQAIARCNTCLQSALTSQEGKPRTNLRPVLSPLPQQQQRPLMKHSSEGEDVHRGGLPASSSPTTPQPHQRHPSNEISPPAATTQCNQIDMVLSVFDFCLTQLNLLWSAMAEQPSTPTSSGGSSSTSPQQPAPTSPTAASAPTSFNATAAMASAQNPTSSTSSSSSSAASASSAASPAVSSASRRKDTLKP
ncbi:hypothetical protein HK102_012408, partial [Quaeritorhiza haematococci]